MRASTLYMDTADETFHVDFDSEYPNFAQVVPIGVGCRGDSGRPSRPHESSRRRLSERPQSRHLNPALVARATGSSAMELVYYATQRRLATAAFTSDQPSAFTVAYTSPDDDRACTYPELRAFAHERTALNAFVETTAQTVQLKRAPVRLDPAYAQYAPVAHVPTAFPHGGGTSNSIWRSGQNTR